MISFILISKTSKINITSLNIDDDREGTKLHPSVDNWIKDLPSMPCPPEEDPVFLTVSLSDQKACISLSFSFIRRQTEEAKTIIPQSPERKPQSQKANQ